MNEEQTWLERLKPGDPVIVHRHWQNPSVNTVERVTPTQVKVAFKNISGTYAIAFRKKDGREVSGASYTFTCIAEATPEAIEKVCLIRKKAKALQIIRDTTFDKLPDETLFQIASLITEAMKPKEQTVEAGSD